jgi:Rad3-related DNA helicase
LKLPESLSVDGLPYTFSDSQKEAIIMALRERLANIHGPPGCGKTLVLAAIVANWMKDPKKVPRILVCAPSNTAADFIAERLY